YALPLTDNINIGASCAVFFRRHVDATAYGGASTVGIDWKILPVLDIGFAFANFGYTTWNTGKSEFGAPSLTLGAQFDSQISAGFSGAVCAEGRFSPQESLFEGFAGAEVSYADIIAIRGGVNNGRFTAGADLRIIRGLRVGAAMGFHYDLPLSYRIGATLERGAAVAD
ncbi:hypothetical protein DRQ36_06380, partial [bacterium]